jgi:hypothetical protein
MCRACKPPPIRDRTLNQQTLATARGFFRRPLDPFAGSGTTLITTEDGPAPSSFDPIYRDRILRRFEQVTGKAATLATPEQSFEAVAEKGGSSPA